MEELEWKGVMGLFGIGLVGSGWFDVSDMKCCLD